MSFWDFPRSSKLDILDERRHTHIYLAAFKDSETDIVEVDRNNYTLYGKDEALLATPQHKLLQLVFMVYYLTVKFLK